MSRATLCAHSAGRVLPFVLFVHFGALFLMTCAAHAVDMSAVANEAVAVDPATGTRTVELPPGSGLGGSWLGFMPFADPGGELFMIETQRGLMECTQRIYRDAECRPPTIGGARHPRTWIVKRHGQWLKCGRPVQNAKCVGSDELFLNSERAL